MDQNLIRIPGDFRVSDRQIIRSLFVSDVYDYPGQLFGLDIIHDKYTGQGITMAVLDTGFYKGHSDLDDEVRVASFVPDQSTDDDHGHGTHVRGIINMQRNGRGLIGIAPGARVHVGKIMANGFGSPEWAAEGLHWAADLRVDIVVGSFGMPRDNKKVKEAVERLAKLGILMFFASGNEGAGRVLFPSALPDAISVGALDASGLLANFSNTGTALDLVAYGVGIKSTWINGNYMEASGTSQATPIAAGIAALYLQKMRMESDSSKYPPVPAFLVRQQLYEWADDLGDSGLDIKFGYGLVSSRFLTNDEGDTAVRQPLKEPPITVDDLNGCRGIIAGVFVGALIWIVLLMLIYIGK